MRSYLAHMAQLIRGIIIAVSLLLLNSSVYAQAPIVNVPQVARDHFAQRYSKAAKQKWKQDSKQIKAEFELKGEKYASIYTPNGEWVRTERNIPKSALPAAVTSALQAGKYASWKIDDVEEHNTPQQSKLYKVKVKTETKKAELFFAPDGKLVREEEKAK